VIALQIMVQSADKVSGLVIRIRALTFQLFIGVSLCPLRQRTTCDGLFDNGGEGIVTKLVGIWVTLTGSGDLISSSS